MCGVGSTWYACWQAGGKAYVKSTGTGNKTLASAMLRAMILPFQSSNRAATLRAALDDAERGGTLNGVSLSEAWTVYGQSSERRDCGAESLANIEARWHRLTAWVAEHRQDVKRVDQAIVGHSSKAMTWHYTHIGQKAAQDAITALPSVGVVEDRGNAPEGVCCPKCGHRWMP